IFGGPRRAPGALVGEGAVIDQYPAMLQAELAGPGAARMGGEPLAMGVAHFADGVDLGLGHHRLLGPRMRHELVARGVELERVDAFAHEGPGGAAALLRSVANHREGRAALAV